MKEHLRGRSECLAWKRVARNSFYRVLGVVSALQSAICGLRNGLHICIRSNARKRSAPRGGQGEGRGRLSGARLCSEEAQIHFVVLHDYSCRNYTSTRLVTRGLVTSKLGAGVSTASMKVTIPLRSPPFQEGKRRRRGLL